MRALPILLALLSGCGLKDYRIANVDGGAGAVDGGAGGATDGPIAPSAQATRLSGTGSDWYAIAVGDDGAWVVAATRTVPGTIEVTAWETAAPSAPVSLGTDVGVVTVSNGVVLLAHGGSLPRYRGQLAYWKPGMRERRDFARQTLVTGTHADEDPLTIPATVSPDGAFIAFVDGFVEATGLGDVELLDVRTPGAPAITLRAGVVAGDTDSDPVLAFSGDSQSIVVASSATTAEEEYAVEAFSVAAPAVSTLPAGTRAWDVLVAGQAVVLEQEHSASASTVSLALLDLRAGAAPRPIATGVNLAESDLDTTAVVTPLVSGRGNYLAYLTAFDGEAGTLSVAPVTSGAPVVISRHVQSLDQFSPDGESLLYLSRYDGSILGGDLLRAASAQAGPGTMVAENASTYFFPAFSPDGGLVFYTDIDAQLTGRMHVRRADGSEAAIRPVQVWQHGFQAGGRVVYCSSGRFVPPDGPGYCDLRVLETATELDVELQRRATIQSVDRLAFHLGGADTMGRVVYTLAVGVAATDGVYLHPGR